MSAATSVGILYTARLDADAVVIDFADDTSAIFTSEQLLSLAPERLKTEFEPPQDWGGVPLVRASQSASSATKWRKRLSSDVVQSAEINKMMELKLPHPGTILRSILRVRQIDEKEFAKFLNIPESLLVPILEGDRDVDIPLSIAISKALSDPSPMRWYQIQEDHDKWNRHMRLDSVTEGRIEPMDD